MSNSNLHGGVRLVGSFSGGRTSALMAKKMKDELRAPVFDLKFVFANTSWEDEDTLRFVHEVDQRFGLDLVWVEAVVHPGRKACTHKVVTYETASRNGEIFEAVVKKYGLPNQSFLHCTRELKLNPINSYLDSIGWGNATTAVGIRSDERRRVRKSAGESSIVYPLADWWPTDKQDVLDYFEPFDWDLQIDEHDGNCRRCHKKSDAKLLRGWREDPSSFEFPIRLDNLYRDVGPNTVDGPRKQYRGHRSASDLVAQFAEAGADYRPPTHDGGCSESCEVYETEELAA